MTRYRVTGVISYIVQVEADMITEAESPDDAECQVLRALRPNETSYVPFWADLELTVEEIVS